MMNEPLNQLSQGLISPKEAYRQLFGDCPKQKVNKPKKAHFIKIRVVIPNETGVTRFLAFLLLMPVPIFLAKIILRKVQLDPTEMGISKTDLMQMVSTRGILINVTAKDGVKIYIKTL
ncbi:MAG: hypothetical protein WC479_03895 [Candidatus Izemoplasmatales bacterium]|jgi:hypothetical protein|nr:hypothetical protein [Candidatus Izemoplasmatales bacterium]MDD3864956.1 hypothetical protein [Candidatus Izemoplasmatales bacterium]